MHLNALKPKNLGPLTKKRLKLNFLLIKLLGKIFFCSEKDFLVFKFFKASISNILFLKKFSNFIHLHFKFFVSPLTVFLIILF